MAFSPEAYGAALDDANKYTDTKFASIPTPYKIRPSVATYEDLPATGNEAGDVRVVVATQARYYWDGDSWQPFMAYNIHSYTITYEDDTTATMKNVEASN